MKRIGYISLAVLAICTVLGAGVAQASPAINGAILYPRWFNDCAVTTLTPTNLYPGLIRIDESFLVCTGGANMHPWDLSADGGGTSAVFNNKDAFSLGAVLRLEHPTGNVGQEGGLRVCPWWDQKANGYFNVRLPDGEIACFGGVLPFFTFTGAFGLHYLAGTDIHIQVIYDPHCNTANDPGTIEYIVDYQGQHFTSGPLAFNNCTSGEEIHGCYGIMDDARVGGRIQQNFGVGGGDPGAQNIGSFFDVLYAPLAGHDCPVPTQNTTWGRAKATYR